ncbi:MAG: GNAT family N-acetyltransferase [Clostridia bacterium]|nr:GNAT family N-acetyltransferase [Clostridia bacterium]
MPRLLSEIPDISRKHDADDLINEFRQAGSSMDGSLGLGRVSGYEEWLEYIGAHKNEETLPAGHVITSAYFAVRESDSRIVGIYNVRHYLNDALILSGNGNVGYCVRPSERRKGYATEILRMALEKCAELQMHDVHVSCYQFNTPSMKVIEKNGGKLYQEYKRPEGLFMEYIIEI